MVVTITRAEVERELLRELIAEELGFGPGQAKQVPSDWRAWLRLFFPRHARHDFAPHHAAMWEWAEAITYGRRPRPRVDILARGGAKSTTAEMMVVYLGARRSRRYAWYICETQEQADDHVQNIAGMLESPIIAEHYPALSEKSVGKFGDQRGWRRARLWTADGLIVDALGLDVASRGKKLEEQRPDLMIFDDLDRQSDGPKIVAKKIRAITRSILPAGTDDVAVLAVQNLIQEDGIFARLAGIADEPADFLADRIVSGPHPAILDAAYEVRDGRTYIVGGMPTWDGQDLAACQRIIDTVGPSAFRVESQHEVDQLEGALFKGVTFKHCQPDDVPDLVQVAVWVDPAVSETDQSDSHGIQADGLAADKTIYRLYSWEGITSPLDSLRRAIQVAINLGAQGVGVETDQGGETWWSVYQQACQSLVADETYPENQKFPHFRSAKAGAGHGPKVERASRQLADYELARIVHVLDEDGSYAALERALRRFPVREPHDLTDASYWSWADLRGRLVIELPKTRPVVRGAHKLDTARWEQHQAQQAAIAERRKAGMLGTRTVRR